MRARLTVTYADERIEDTTAIVPDFVAWERRTKRRSSDLVNGVGIEDLAFLAWHSLKRQTGTRLEFDRWIEEIVEIEMGDDPAPKAGRREASTGSSLSSS